MVPRSRIFCGHESPPPALFVQESRLATYRVTSLQARPPPGWPAVGPCVCCRLVPGTAPRLAAAHVARPTLLTAEPAAPASIGRACSAPVLFPPHVQAPAASGTRPGGRAGRAQPAIGGGRWGEGSWGNLRALLRAPWVPLGPPGSSSSPSRFQTRCAS